MIGSLETDWILYLNCELSHWGSEEGKSRIEKEELCFKPETLYKIPEGDEAMMRSPAKRSVVPLWTSVVPVNILSVFKSLEK